MTDTDKGLAEMARVTLPGGRVVILEFSQPRHWLFGRIYRAYFRWVLPAVGQLISRSKDNAYNYLPASVMQFPDGEALAHKLHRHGLVEVAFYPLTFGIATLYIGVKPGIGERGAAGNDLTAHGGHERGGTAQESRPPSRLPVPTPQSP